MPKPTLEVLYEDNHLLVVNKPAGLATQGVAEGTPSVVTRAKDYLKRKYKKPGNVYLGVVSRLDSTVSGVLVLARTSKAAQHARLAYRTIGKERLGTLMEVRLGTGRKHQIRLQMATIGCPILGDR